MSSSDRPARARLLTLAALGAALALVGGGLAGCTEGPRPLYGKASGGTVEALKSIDIAAVPGRVGQQVRNELVFGFYGGEGEGPGQAGLSAGADRHLHRQRRRRRALSQSPLGLCRAVDRDLRPRRHRQRRHRHLGHRLRQRRLRLFAAALRRPSVPSATPRIASPPSPPPTSATRSPCSSPLVTDAGAVATISKAVVSKANPWSR